MVAPEGVPDSCSFNSIGHKLFKKHFLRRVMNLEFQFALKVQIFEDFPSFRIFLER